MDLSNELVQTLDPLFINGLDNNSWSRVHKRFLSHEGCIVDLGCLKWDWSKYFFYKKRIIGADPQEDPSPPAEFFKGAVSNFSGKGELQGQAEAVSLKEKSNGDIDVLSWADFKNKFNIDKISILKINTEGGEYDFLNSLVEKDYESIDQIAVSFHDWIYSEWKPKTDKCINDLMDMNYDVIDLGIFGWKLFIKKY